MNINFFIVHTISLFNVNSLVVFKIVYLFFILLLIHYLYSFKKIIIIII